MDFAFILDPLPLLKAYKDSSVAMMRSLAARGHRIFALTPADLYWHAGTTRARVAALDLACGRARLVYRGARPRSARSPTSPRS